MICSSLNLVELFIFNVVDRDTRIEVLSDESELFEIDRWLSRITHVPNCFTIACEPKKPTKSTTCDQHRIDITVEARPRGLPAICDELLQN